MVMRFFRFYSRYLLVSMKPDLTPPPDTGGPAGPGGGNPGGGGPNPPPPSKPCDPDTVYFQTQILPIFVSNCAIPGCHDRTTAQDDVILTDYANILMEIDPGDPESSDVYERLTDDDPEDLMPRNPQNYAR